MHLCIEALVELQYRAVTGMSSSNKSHLNNCKLNFVILIHPLTSLSVLFVSVLDVTFFCSAGPRNRDVWWMYLKLQRYKRVTDLPLVPSLQKKCSGTLL